jgi:dihydroorotate dehydrogenase
MGWYAAVGRPAFFSLPPETAHRVAGVALGFPLPWRLIGGASDDPVLAADLCGIPLRNPIGLAAGFDKTCRRLGALGALGFGYVVGGTITRAPRHGNPAPRIVRSPRARSIVNSMGLPNPGSDAARSNLVRDQALTPRVVSLADEATDDAAASIERLAPLADAIELNASCPNVSWGRDRDTESHLRRLVWECTRRTDVPIVVKLPPFVADAEREAVLAIAKAAKDAGADGLTCSNTRPVADPRLADGVGGLSGKGLWPHTPRIVAQVREATAGELPVHACGGVFDADDALDCLDAGASTVQVYSALIYQGPGIVGDLTRGIAERLRARAGAAPAVSDPTGTAHGGGPSST